MPRTIYAARVRKGDHFILPPHAELAGREAVAVQDAGVLPHGWRPMIPGETVIQWKLADREISGNLVAARTRELELTEGLDRITALERRISRLEEHLGINGP